MNDEAVILVDMEDEVVLEGCFDVLRFLRPHLDISAFRERVRIQTQEGYRLACIAPGGTVAAVAGFRIAHFMAWGRVLYVDDLATRPQRRRSGLGGRLVDWLAEEARRQACDALHLDSGHQRHDAHRLYLNKGLIINSHHFVMDLSTDGRYPRV